MSGLRILLVGMVLTTFSSQSRAMEPFGLGTWEISVPPAAEIKDQGKFPYCGLYAMSSFLELWAKGGTPSFAYPSMDQAYLGMTYNRTVGAGNRGTHPLWLAMSAQVYGAIPKNSRITDSTQWPLPDWTAAHDGLMNRKILDPILKGTYRHSITSATFTGRQYMERAIRIDFRQLVGLSSNLNEPTKPSEKTPPPARLRAGTYQRTVATMNRLSSRLGIRGNFTPVTPRQFYMAVRRQLYARRPVMLSINAGLTEKRFAGYKLVDHTSLVPVGTGRNYSHAVVAVAHCNNEDSRDAICRRFGRYLERSKAKECVVIQNSWGAEVHERGYACLTPSAFARIGKAALLHAGVLRN